MVSENTSVSIDELSGSDDGVITRLALETGKVWTNIKEKLNRNSTYEIKTPTATMGVRGTKFYVDSANDYTKVAVLDGTVSSSTTITTRDPEGRIKMARLISTI